MVGGLTNLGLLQNILYILMVEQIGLFLNSYLILPAIAAKAITESTQIYFSQIVIEAFSLDQFLASTSTKQ